MSGAVPEVVLASEAGTPTPLTEAYVRQLYAEFPQLRLVAKANSPFSALIDRALRVLSFGKMSAYQERYVTVIGGTIYLPARWCSLADAERVIVLRHERIHLLQSRRMGALPMAAYYLLPVFPVGLAWGRARIEWEAYVETLRATAELEGMDAARSPALRARIVSRFTGPEYLWMWPFPAQVERWYDEALVTIERERGHT